MGIQAWIDFIWAPNDTQIARGLVEDERLCRWKVWRTRRQVQCANLATQRLDGYGLCTMHFKRVKEFLA